MGTIVIISIVWSMGVFPWSVWGLDVSHADEPGQVLQHTDTGQVNWSQGVVTAKGIQSPLEERAKASAIDRQVALIAAKKLGWQNLLQTIREVRIHGQYLVADLMVANPMILTTVEEMVTTARVTKQEYLSDGTVAVTVELALYGGFSQLVLPPEIKQVEPVKPMARETTPPAKPEAEAPTGQAVPRESPFSGLVIDTRGLDLRPVLYPVIEDEAGQPVYGSAFVSREFAVQRGMAGYEQDLAKAIQNPRVADHPLTVKGLRIREPGSSRIVISNANALKIRSAPEHLSFLKECRVIMVVD